MLRVDLAGINPKNSRMILEFQLSYRAGLLTTSDIHIISRGTEKDKRENEDYYSRLLKNRRRKNAVKRKKMTSGRKPAFFLCEPSVVSKHERMKVIALKSKDGGLKGKISFVL